MRIQRLVRSTAFVLAALASTGAQAFEPADKAGIRKVIRQQVAAIGQTDAASFANTVSPDLRARFRNDDALYGILVGKVPVLETARSVAFGPLRTTPRGLVQMLLFTDQDGHPHVGLFVMERRQDRWFVSAVAVKRMPAELI